MIETNFKFGVDSGWVGSGRQILPDTTIHQPIRVTYPAHEITRQFDLDCLRRSLPSQRGLSLGELVGANWRVRRGPSLGESTSAGAENSQATLHAAKRPTMTAYRFRAKAEPIYPNFAFAPSESGMTIKEQVKKRAWSNYQLSLRRTGVHCPKWAKRGKVFQKTLAIYTRAAWKNQFRFAYGKTGEFYHVDHKTPLHGKHVSGLHVPWNLHVIPATINLAKGTMIVEEYLKDKPDQKFLDWFADSLD